IAVAGEQDVYTFTLAAPSQLLFDSLTNNGSLTWTLTGPAGAAVTNRPFNASDTFNNSTNPVLSLPAGNYVLRVQGSGGATGAYSFRLWDLAQATALTPGTPVSADLTPTNETDLYRFSAAAGSQFYFDVQAHTGANSSRWDLVDPYGKILF